MRRILALSAGRLAVDTGGVQMRVAGSGHGRRTASDWQRTVLAGGGGRAAGGRQTLGGGWAACSGRRWVVEQHTCVQQVTDGGQRATGGCRAVQDCGWRARVAGGEHELCTARCARAAGAATCKATMADVRSGCCSTRAGPGAGSRKRRKRAASGERQAASGKWQGDCGAKRGIGEPQPTARRELKTGGSERGREAAGRICARGTQRAASEKRKTCREVPRAACAAAGGRQPAGRGRWTAGGVGHERSYA